MGRGRRGQILRQRLSHGGRHPSGC
jgi:hypothetical protein